MTDLRTTFVAATAAAFLSTPFALTSETAEAETMTQSTEKSFQVAGGEIAYSDTGTGPLVVLLPGLGDVKEEYRLLVPHLVDAGYRAIAMDLRGHGGSSTGWDDYSAEAIAGDALALVDHLDAGPAFVVGTSMGAGAAAYAAAIAPDKVSGIVLAGAFVRDVPPESWFKGVMFNALAKVITSGPWAPTTWTAYYKSLYPSNPPADLDDYTTALKANLSEPGRMDAVRGMANASKAGVEARLGDISAPTFVVMGTADPDFPNPQAEAELIAERTNGTVLMVEGAGHYPSTEMHESVGPAIVDFLKGQAAI